MELQIYNAGGSIGNKNSRIAPLQLRTENSQIKNSGKSTDEVQKIQTMAEENGILLLTHLNSSVRGENTNHSHTQTIAPLLPTHIKRK